ncbi:unnamed protein product [Calypogeia fissa]
MDPAELIAPVFGIAAAAAITFYTVSFMQMSDKSFEDLGEQDSTDPTVLRSSQSNKEKRKLRKDLKQQQAK